MKDDNLKEIIVNHNYFIRMVINEIINIFGVSVILGVLVYLVFSFLPNISWVAAILVILYPIYIFIKMGKIKIVHDHVTSVEDRIVENSIHSNESSDHWKL